METSPGTSSAANIHKKLDFRQKELGDTAEAVTLLGLSGEESNVTIHHAEKAPDDVARPEALPPPPRDDNIDITHTSFLLQDNVNDLLCNIDSVELINKVYNCSSNTTSGDKEVKERFLEYELKKVLNSTSDNKFSTDIYESLKEKSEAAIPAASPDYVLYKSIRQEAQKFVKIRHHRTSLEDCLTTGRVPKGLSLWKKIGVINTNPRLEVEVRRIQYEAELKMIDSLAKHYKYIYR